MAGAHSTDLRRRVLAAVEAGESPDAAARRFAAGRSTAYRRVAAAREEGRRAAKPMGGGPAPAIRGGAEAALRRMLAGNDNHPTLAGCRDRLAAGTGVRVHPWAVGRALRRIGRTWKERALPPELRRTRPDAAPVMDNPGAHNAHAVRDPLDRSSFAHRFLPSYPPDLSPIEPAWAEVKAALRRVGARTAEAPHRALGPALDAITARDAPGFSRHAGCSRPK